MSLLIVIVNYRTGPLVVDCLASVDAQRQDPALPATRVVVTDNASGDGSDRLITDAVTARGWGAWCTVMPLPRNGGFAYGNNAAITPALASDDPPDFVLLLNGDTVLRPGALRALLDFTARHPQAGIFGSRLENPDGTPQRSAFRFPSPAGEFEWGTRLGPVSRVLKRYVVAPPVSDTPTTTDWVAGASMLVRRGVFERVGLLDEGYFMYFEEVDFCRRAAGAGFATAYVPESRVVHLVGQASGVTDATKRNRRRPAYWFESRRRYFLKFYGRAGAAAADLLLMTGFASWRLRRRLQRKPDEDPQRFLADVLSHSVLRRGFSLPGATP